MSRMNFQTMLEQPTVHELAERVATMHSWESSMGRQAQTAATVIAMRQLEDTTKLLDAAATELQEASLGLARTSLRVSIAGLVVAGGSLAIAIAALVVAIVK